VFLGRFVGRWLADAIGLAVPLAVAILAMQLPALSGEYAAAPPQVSDAARRDIDQREDSARGYYRLPPGAEDDLLRALREKEPSNAEGLARSLERQRDLRAAYDRIEAAAWRSAPPPQSTAPSGSPPAR
jgi:hypothetical protein